MHRLAHGLDPRFDTGTTPVRSRTAGHLARFEHLLDQLQFGANKKNVVHLELLSVGPGRVYDQITGAEAEQPAATQPAAPPRDDHPPCVVRDLAAADLLVDLQLPRG